MLLLFLFNVQGLSLVFLDAGCHYLYMNCISYACVTALSEWF